MHEESTYFWKLLFQVSDRLRELEDEKFSSECRQAAFSLTINQLRMMRMVADLREYADCEVTLKLLSEKLQITPAAASEMVETLVQKGSLTRKQSRVDRRAISVELSEGTVKFLEERQAGFDRIVGEYLKSLPVEEVACVLRALKGFREYLSTEEERFSKK